ncbi:O-antigen ligase family protein [Aestuariivirga litoralis]|uniref:O-antigen ligase family protein n=1 Tax=Aestuariivirga litoralis TaxID=2650924 RepID=UPI0018C75370|nr:O-antigen ligase family protein [Aestuariivirga litoralis]
MDSNLKPPSAAITQSLWPLAFSAYLCFMLVSGGTSLPSDTVIYLQSALSLAVLVAALSQLAARGLPSKLAVYASWLAIFSAALPLLQLIPLPPSVWSQLATHQVALKNIALLGAVPSFMPLSLAPEQTRLDAIALLPALASFFGTLSIPLRRIPSAIWVILACALVSLVLALLQVAQGELSPFYLYGAEPGTGTGTFSNRNFFAAQAYIALVFIGALAAHLKQKYRWHGGLVALFAAGGMALLLVSLALAGSRSGIVLAMPAIVFALLLLYGGTAALNLKTSAVTLVAVIASLFVIGQSSMLGLLRLASGDPFSDARAGVARASLSLLKNTLPLGSGFGSFVPLYQMIETPAMLQSQFINHVHNDWLELAIEGGAPALLLEAFFVIFMVFGIIRVWRYGRGGTTAIFQRAASLALPLLLLHALVDFPLRTPALLSLFAFCVALLTLPPDVAPPMTKPNRTRTGSKTPPKPGHTPATPAPFRRPDAPFGPKSR